MKILRISLVLIVVVVKVNLGVSQSFSATSFFDASGFVGASFSAADFDHDGNDEMLVCGYNWGNPRMSVYTIKNGIPEKITIKGLPDVAISANWFDLEADGDLDIFLEVPVLSSRSAAIYVNNNGNFSLLNTQFPAFKVAVFSTADYDGDADIDVLVSGADYEADAPTTILFRNNNSAFQPVKTALQATSKSTMAWADFDKDKDLDVVISRNKKGDPHSAYYRNDGNGLFKQVAANLPYDQVTAQDFDNDGDIDLLGNETFSIMVNNGKGEFSSISNFNLPGRHRWADYDTDGDLDLFHFDHENATSIFEYNGTSYSRLENSGLPPTFDFGFIDYDHDGDLDFAALEDHLTARIYRNNFNSNPYPLDNRPAGISFLAAQPIDASSILIEWVDNNTQAPTVNIEISTDGVIFSEYITGTPNPIRHVVAGLTQDLQYSFRVRMQNEFGFSEYSDVIRCRTANVAFTKSALPSITKINSSSMADFDSDGDVDLIFSGSQLSEMKTYFMRNDDGHFSIQSSTLSTLNFYDMDAADFDHDGDMDLLLSGYRTASEIRSFIVKNDGDFNFEISKELIPVFGHSRWIEINGDGYPDIYVSGTADFNNTVHLNQVLINQKDGTFTEITDHGLPVMYQADLATGDFNNDGRTDIAIAGFKDSLIQVNVTEVYLNQGDKKFKFAQYLGGSANSSKVQLADLDNDGDLDLVAGIFGEPLRIYKNKNGTFYEDARNKLAVIHDGVHVLGDIDNDGDTDIIFGGIGNLITRNVVYLNDGSGLFKEGYFPLTPYLSNYTLGDIDNDGALDIFESGSGFQGPTANILVNKIATQNLPPQPPVILKKQQVPGGFYMLIDRGSDDHTNAKALTVNMYVRNSNGEFLFNSFSDNVTGKLKRPANGNMSLNDSILIQTLDPGTYTVGVQNIDNSYNASAFTTTTILVELLAPMLVKNLRTCEGQAADIEVVGNNINWFTDATLTHSISLGNLFNPLVAQTDTIFYAVQQYQQMSGPVLQVQVLVDPMIQGNIRKEGSYLLAPEASSYQWFRNDSLLVGFTEEKIRATIPGTYRIKASQGACVVDSISFKLTPNAPVVSGASEVCVPNEISLESKGEGLSWYDAENNIIGTGQYFTREILSTSDTAVWTSQTVSNLESAKTLTTWHAYTYPEKTLTLNNTAILAPPAQHYQWYKDFNLLEKETGPELQLKASGVYCCRLSNSGCSVVTDNIVYILTSLEDLQQNRIFNYYVNNNTLTINLPEREIEDVTLYDVSGKTVLNVTNPLQKNGDYVIELGSLQPGIYIFVINGLTQYKARFIKLP
jgi:hypothetical protein